MSPSLRAPSQADIESIAKTIMAKGRGKVSIDSLPLVPRRMMRLAMNKPELRTQLFRLVDVYPALWGNEDANRHLEEYLADNPEVPSLLRFGVRGVSKLPYGTSISARMLRRNLEEVARLFIAGTTPQEIVEKVKRYSEEGLSTTVDVLGEKTLTDGEASTYALRVLELVDALKGDNSATEDTREIPLRDPSKLPSVSIKPTALSPHYSSLGASLGLSEVKARLGEVLSASAGGTMLCFLDMEDLDVKDLTIDLVEDLAFEPESETVELGVVIQAYLKNSLEDLARVLGISRRRVSMGRPPLWVRLVKGAYYDAETVKAAEEGWPNALFPHKELTDANYERCVDLLLENHANVHPAFGTHNLRSISYIVANARARGLDAKDYEIQMLYGMAESLAKGVRAAGVSVRMYLPMGELLPGMSYLVRRLLENTANESFLRQGFIGGAHLPIKTLVAPPETPLGAPRDEEIPSLETPYAHCSALPFYQREVRDGFRHRIEMFSEGGVSRLFGEECGKRGFIPAVVNGERIATAGLISSLNPARPSQVVAVSSASGEEEVKLAVSVASEAFRAWSQKPPEERANLLLKAAAWMKGNRRELAALQVVEAGKPWREADGDVTEAVDFLEFYAREMVRISKGAPLMSPLGEYNRQEVRPRGITAVISPWNFPLAIPTGMVAGALVAGNCVILKPAEQTPATAFAILRAFEHAGLPRGVLTFLPGDGVAGGLLVKQSEINTVAFTGSYDVGARIMATSVPPDARGSLRRVIAELGGKNSIVIDADADLDQVVPGVMNSAFGFAGQKCSACSRVIVHADRALETIERLSGNLRSLVVGDPVRPEVQVGPLIDEAAKASVERYLSHVDQAEDVVSYGQDLPHSGYFVPPTIFIEPNEDSPVRREEIFGPVLSVEIADSLPEAIELANDSKYALTAGVFSRSPKNISYATQHLEAGNIYVNRHITGAVPGRQPFGGHKRSGLGSKAGGAEYLHHFLDPVVITENTLRQGFVPLE